MTEIAAQLLEKAVRTLLRGNSVAGALIDVKSLSNEHLRSALEAKKETSFREILATIGVAPSRVAEEEKIQEIGGVPGVARIMTDNTLADFRQGVDAAALVFMHSALDDAVFDYCQVSRSMSPGDWESTVRKRKVELGSLVDRDYKEVRDEVLDKYFAQLKKESLLSRVQTLLSICKPSSGKGGGGYEFSEQRIEKLDELRHDMVHRKGPSQIDTIRNDVDYLLGTGVFLFGLVMDQYKLYSYIDVTELFRPASVP